MGDEKSVGKMPTVARRKEAPEEEMERVFHVIQPAQTLASGYALAVTTDA